MWTSLGAKPVAVLTEHVVFKFGVRELLIPVIVDHHRQQLGHRVIKMIHTTIAIWVVGAGGNFRNPKKLVDGLRKL